MNALGKDFDLRWGVPGGMPLYRKSLALGFLYRFYHEVLSELDVGSSALDGDARGEIERAISAGKKDHEAAQAYEQRILGKAEPHVAALKQCTGEVVIFSRADQSATLQVLTLDLLRPNTRTTSQCKKMSSTECWFSLPKPMQSFWRSMRNLLCLCRVWCKSF